MDTYESKCFFKASSAGAVLVQVGAGRRPVHVAQLQHLQGHRSTPQHS